MPYTNMEDFKKADGFTDWAAYEKAKRKNGESCTDCGKYLIFGVVGFPRLCGACTALIGRNEVEHHSMIRCPGCGHSWRVEDLYQEGEHDVTCQICDCEFQVTTKVSFSFVSPERIREDDCA